MSDELLYIGLLFALFVVPRFLQRFGIPTAISSFALGGVAGMGFGLFVHDNTVHLLATFGIVSLFLFAGLEVDFVDLKRGAKVIAQHLAIRLATLIFSIMVLRAVLGVEARPAALIGLALLTPSTGFILDSLPAFGLHREERFWVKSTAIATELLALVTMFVVLRSASVATLALSGLGLLSIAVALPVLFRLFASRVAPFAPKSEFAFLLMLAVVSAFATRHLGVYYLVGAFLVGIAAQRFRDLLPAMTSEKMLHSIEVFTSFFVPFYFFNAGVHLPAKSFGVGGLLTGLGFLAVALPLKLGLTLMHRRFALREEASRSRRVALSLLPTLVFTLVLAEILRDQFNIAPNIFAGLIVFTLVNTLIPGFILRVPVVDPEVLYAVESDLLADESRDSGEHDPSAAPDAPDKTVSCSGP